MPVNSTKLRGLLGLALRSRQGVTGTEACRILIASGQCGIMLLDGAAGENTRKKFDQLCRKTGTRMGILPEGMIQSATGKEQLAIAIRKGTISEQVSCCLNEDGNE